MEAIRYRTDQNGSQPRDLIPSIDKLISVTGNYFQSRTLQDEVLVRHALEAAGVESIADNGGVVGCNFVRQGGNDRGND